MQYSTKEVSVDGGFASGRVFVLLLLGVLVLAICGLPAFASVQVSVGAYSIEAGESLILNGWTSWWEAVPGTHDYEFQWDLDDDGDFDDAVGASPTVSWATLESLGLGGVGTYTIRFQGIEYLEGSPTDTDVDSGSLTITSSPSAHAGGTNGVYAIDEGASLYLDASGSTSPGVGGLILLYEWDLDNDGSFDDASSSSPYITVPWSTLESIDVNDDGTYTLILRITDSWGGQGVDIASLIITNVPPTPSAGGPYSMTEGASLSLAGSATDPSSADVLAYAWDIDGDGYYDDGASASLSVSWSTLEMYSLNDDGSYTLSLRVSDDDGASTIDTATLTIMNTAPSADANGPYTVYEGNSRTFDASGSSDPSSVDVLTYTWDLNYGGAYNEASGVSPTASWAQLVSYGCGDDGSYTIGLRVADDDGGIDTDTATITVKNTAPTADPGGPYSVAEGASVSLSGSGTDPSPWDSLSYAWDLDGDLDFSDGAGGAIPTVPWLTLVAHGIDDDGSYSLNFRVADDDGGEDIVSVSLTVTNTAPSADAGGLYTISEGDDLQLDASGSSDPSPADTLSYAWDLDDDGLFDDAVGGTPLIPWATLDGLAVNDDGSYSLAVRVTDDDGGWSTDTASLTISNTPPAPDAGGPYSMSEGDDLSLDASVSADPSSADTLSYAWDLDDDGLFDDAAGATPLVAWAMLDSLSVNDDGIYTLEVKVTDDDGGWSTDTASLTISNTPPTPDAGGPYSMSEGDDLSLDASASADPSSADALQYFWDLDDDGVSDDATGSTPTVPWATLDSLAVNDDGIYTLEVLVIDDDSGSSTDTVLLTISNTAPTSDAGGPYSISEGDDLGIDASGSTDPSSADTLSYAWDLDDDGLFDDAIGSTLSIPWAALDGLDVNDDGAYTLEVQVTDDDGGWSTDTAALTISNTAPTADAGGPYAISEGDPLTLDASVSVDPSSADTLSYAWDLDDDGFHDDATGSNPTIPWATLVSLGIDDDGTYTLEVQVTDDDGGWSTDTVLLTISNTAPTADAGGPYAINEGDPLTLDASGSGDPSPVDVLSYAWDLDDDGAFDDTTGSNPTIPWATLVSLGIDDEGTYLIAVLVSDDDGGTDISVASVTVSNTAPVADANGPYLIDEGDALELDGSGSSDADLDVLFFYWDLDGDEDYDDGIEGDTPEVPWAVLCAFGVCADASYDIRLRVMDEDGWLAHDTAELTIVNVVPRNLVCPDERTVYYDDVLHGLSGSFEDPGDDAPWLGEIDWGDGIVDPVSVDDATQTFMLPDHTYLSAPPGETAYDATVTIEDDDGNGTCTFTVSVIHDVEPPDVAFTLVPEPINNDPAPRLEWTGTDDFTAVDEIEYRYRLDGGAWSEWSTDTSAELGRPFDGDHLFEVEARDIAENISEPIVAEWRTDLSCPIIHLNVPTFYGAYILNSLVLVDWETFDNVTDVLSAVGTMASGAYLDTSRIGPFTFIVSSTDLAGNTAEVSIPYRVIPALQAEIPEGASGIGVDNAPLTGEPGASLELWGFLSRSLEGIYDEEGNLIIRPLLFVRDEPISVAFRLADALGEFLIYESGCVWVDVARVVPDGFLDTFELVAAYEVPYDPVRGLYACQIPYGEVGDWWAVTPGLYKLSLTIKAAWVNSLVIETIWLEVPSP